MTGINISRSQLEVARELAEGLPVEFVECDYRDLSSSFGAQTFDHVVSAGMFEHVGDQNYPRFFDEIATVLKTDGLFLLHTVGSNVSVHQNDPWYDRYIYMNGVLPSVAQIGAATENRFTMEDWHNFGYDYYLTLSAWYRNFREKWDGPHDDMFYRMWKYFLLCSAGQFLARRHQLWHVVLAKTGLPKGYVTVR